MMTMQALFLAAALSARHAPPTWDQTLPAEKRFKLVMFAETPGCVPEPPISICIPMYQAVLDLETGLVWERFPGTATLGWPEAAAACYASNLGGRGGWRLPTVEELRSLVDPSVPLPGPTLPPGHPFGELPTANPAPVFWSATTVAGAPDLAWGVEFNGGEIRDGGKHGLGRLVWCVRGGQGPDGR